MVEQRLILCNKNLKNQEYKKCVLSSCSATQKQSRKCDDPIQFIPTAEQSSDYEDPTSWICKNSACKAALSINDAFCWRCYCCICHQFDDNKDPSLWLVCESESASEDSCGLSCHVECAFKQKKLGVVNLGQFMQLDGSYCCVSCGKVSGILGCLKKQLAIAKDTPLLEVLCYRVFLSYTLLNGTSRFTELHQIISEAKRKLEAELGPMNAESVKLTRGIVSRFSVASDVQKLCSNAIEKAEEYILKIPTLTPNCTVDSIPAACRFLFEEVTSSSLAIVLINIPSPFTNNIIGYKLWCSKTSVDTFSEDPSSIIPRNKRIYVKHLMPSTEYTFRIMPYTETRDLGHSEAKCFTKSVESMVGSSSGFMVRDSGKNLHLPWDKKQGCLEGFCTAAIEQCCGITKFKYPKDQKPKPVIRELDLNVVSVPDLNEDFTLPLESSRGENNGPDDDVASNAIEKNGPSSGSCAWAPIWSRDFDSSRRKRGPSAIEETHDYDSTPMNGSSFRLSIGSRTGSVSGPGLESVDGRLEFCVKVIRWLECQGYINREFRLKLLTWFCLKSNDQERRVVNTFIETLKDDPKSLAGQLVDSFADIIASKRPRNSYTSKLTPILS